MLTPQRQNSLEKPSLLQLFLFFIALGATAFGGVAMVPYIHRLAVDDKRWLRDESFRDGVALCQAIPGATSIQVSTYVGFRAAGLAGAAVTFLAFSLPAFVFMMILSALYARFHALPAIIVVFGGLQAIVVAIVAAATISFGRTTLRDAWDVALAALAALLYTYLNHPFLVVLVAGVLGVIVFRKVTAPEERLTTSASPHYEKSFLLLLLGTGVALILLFFGQRRLFDLVILMFKIAVAAFGGGFAALPLMFHEIVQVRHWMDGPTFLNGIALGQLTPGPVVITAGFIGYLLSGPVGGAVATLAVFFPSFLILLALVPSLDRLRHSPYFRTATRGILGSFVGLLLTVTIHLAATISWDYRRIFLTVASFVALLLGVRIPWVVLPGILISWLIF